VWGMPQLTSKSGFTILELALVIAIIGIISAITVPKIGEIITAVQEKAVAERMIEDLYVSLKRMKREQENMLDLSPKDANSLILASDFDSKSYTQKDIDLGVKIRNAAPINNINIETSPMHPP